MYIDCETFTDGASGKIKNKKAFYTIAALVRIHLIILLEMPQSGADMQLSFVCGVSVSTFTLAQTPLRTFPTLHVCAIG